LKIKRINLKKKHTKQILILKKIEDLFLLFIFILKEKLERKFIKKNKNERSQ